MREGSQVVTARGHRVEQQVSEPTAHPRLQGDVEARFRRVQHAVGKGAPERLAQDVLAAAPAVELVGRRQVGGERHELHVQKRDLHLEAVGHAHPVYLDENVVRQVEGRVGVEQPGQRLAGRGRDRPPRGVGAERVVPRHGPPEVLGEDARLASIR